jgi:hypothetical protein
MRGVTIAAAAALLAGCSGEAPAPEPESESAALSPGLYEASWTVSSVRSTDRTEPATELKQDAKGTARACVDRTGAIDPSLFAEGDDECRPTSSYARGGRLALQMECSRPGGSGQVMQSVNGTTTADGFEAEVSTSTYLAGPGDYAMTRTVTGRRVGECPPAGAAGEANAAG